MIKRLYLANGTLQTSLPKWADDITLDAVTAAYITSILYIGDWAYLAISYLDNFEVIKVYLTYAGLEVARGQDGTCRQSFPAGSMVTYVLTQAEVQDATAPAAINLYADIAGVMQVLGGGGTYTIGYTDPSVQCEGGVQVYFTDTDATLHIDDWFPAAGCCNAAGNGAPLIGGPDFYLTSQPYSVEVVEDYIAPNPATRANHWGNNNFGWGPIWPLTQPFINQEFVDSVVAIAGLNTFGTLGSFSATEGYVQASAIQVFGITVSGGLKTFQANEGYVQANAYILQMSVTGNIIQYNNDVEKYVKSLIAVNSITVS